MTEERVEVPIDEVDPADRESDAAAAAAAETQPRPDVTDPAKLIRLGTMLQAVLSELRGVETDDAGVQRLANIHRETISELEKILSEDLHDELMEFNSAFSGDESGAVPSSSEVRVAHAQLVGWIQGLLRGMQATAQAQAKMAQQQMMMMQAQQAQQQAMLQAAGMTGQNDSGPMNRGDVIEAKASDRSDAGYL